MYFNSADKPADGFIFFGRYKCQQHIQKYVTYKNVDNMLKKDWQWWCADLKNSNEIVKIRTSRILDIRDDNSVFFKGQHHAEQRNIDKDKNIIIQNEVTVSKLRSYFENPNYDYIKRVEMITTISENDIPGVKVFIKRIPTLENRVLDIFGKRDDIKNFLDQIMAYGKNVLLNTITNTDYEDENFTNYNLRFADINGIIEEEVEIFNLIK